MRPVSLAAIAALVAVAPAQAAAPALKFSYTYPPQARAIPALKAWLDRNAAQDRTKMLADANDDRESSVKEGRPFHPYEADRTWKVVTDTPRFLSLSQESYDYTGGAHGNTAFDAMLWDKAANHLIEPLDLFTSKAALTRAIQPAFCRQLDAERRQKRGGSGASGTDIAEFDKCLDPTQSTVILGSTNRQQFTRIGVLLGPYEAGSYAEGPYDVTVPVTPAVIAAVKPQWRRYFAVPR